MIDPLIKQLESASLIVTAGCGGVGKTTVAAALALRAADLGRRVAVPPSTRQNDSLKRWDSRN